MAVQRFQATLTPASVAAIVCVEQAFTVGPGGMNPSAVVSVSKPTAQTAAPVGARVSSPTQISITFCNPTAGAIVPTAAEVYQFTVTD